MIFSIIVPSYNRKAEIPALLSALERQTRFNFEVVIVDDCSREAVAVIGEYPFPVRVIRNQQNQGAAQSRNIGAAAAQGEWLLFLDDDDRFSDDKCAVLEDCIEQNPTVNFLYHPAKCSMVNEGFSYVTKPYQNPQDLTVENILRANKIGGMPMIAVTKALFEKVGGLSGELRSLEDYDFLLKLLQQSEFKPLFINEPLTLCAFHTRRDSVSTDSTNTQKAIAYIRQHYVKTDEQASNFTLNSEYMLAYPKVMNLSRAAAPHYWRIFRASKNLKALAICLVILISPQLAINLKRYI